MGIPGSETVVFAIYGPIERDDLPGLYARVCGLLESTGARTARCDVAGIGADAVVVEALARLELAARRRQCTVEFRNATRALRELITFMGLSGVVAG